MISPCVSSSSPPGTRASSCRAATSAAPRIAPLGTVDFGLASAGLGIGYRSSRSGRLVLDVAATGNAAFVDLSGSASSGSNRSVLGSSTSGAVAELALAGGPSLVLGPARLGLELTAGWTVSPVTGHVVAAANPASAASAASVRDVSLGGIWLGCEPGLLHRRGRPVSARHASRTARARLPAVVAVVAIVTSVAVAGLASLCCGVEGTVLREVDEAALDGSPGDAAPTLDASDDAELDTSTTFPADAARGDASGVFTGQYSSCDLAAGLASCWGSNLLGQLGTGSREDDLSPTALGAAPGFTSLSGGQSHTCGVGYGSGAVSCWGSDAYGQLGQGEPASALDASSADPSPLRVSLVHPAMMVAAGYEHTCAILTDGSLWCWGDNDEGQLGLDDAYGSPSYPTPQRVGSGTDWRAVSGGQGHSCGLRAAADGGSGRTLWCWGRDSGGELGLGTGQPMQTRVPTQVGTAADWAQLDTGQDEGCAVRTDGTLWCWGVNISGELTPAVGATLYVPTQIRRGRRLGPRRHRHLRHLRDQDHRRALLLGTQRRGAARRRRHERPHLAHRHRQRRRVLRRLRRPLPHLRAHHRRAGQVLRRQRERASSASATTSGGTSSPRWSEPR